VSPWYTRQDRDRDHDRVATVREALALASRKKSASRMAASQGGRCRLRLPPRRADKGSYCGAAKIQCSAENASGRLGVNKAMTQLG
jgi:hypothetical protein